MKKKVLLGALLCLFSAQFLNAQQANLNGSACPLPPVTTPIGQGSPALATLAVVGCPGPTPTPTPTPIPTPTPVTGTIEPKYVVLTVTYAPPGASSSVTYSNSTLLGTSSSVTNSFTNDVNLTASITTGFSLFGLFGGQTTQTASTQLTQQTDTSSTVAVNETTNTSTTIRGPASSAIGLDHDEDIIWVWLNPVTSFTINSSSNFTWTGFGFDQNDPVGTTDILGIPVKYLNGHAPMPSDIADVLARRWAPRTLCTSTDPACVGGTKDPGLDASDLAAILQADPFASPSYVVNIPTGSNCTADKRFCRTTNQNLQYSPPPPGGQPITQTFSIQHQATATEGQGATDTRKVGIGTQGSISGSFFVSLSAKLMITDTLTWSNRWNAMSTSQTGQTATASITGPSSSDNYTGPVEFEIFQDNIYGTFMFGFIPPPTFTLSASPGSQSVVQGGSCANYTASIGALVSGFASTVSFNVTGVPANATASFSPASITGAGSSTLTVCAPSTTALGASTLTINAVSGIEVHGAPVTFAVTNFTIGATPSSRSVVVGGSASYTVSTTAQSGFSGAVSLSASGLPAGASAVFTPASITGAGSSTLSIATSAATPPGTYTPCIAASSGGVTHSVCVTLTATAVPTGDFTLSATPSSQTVAAGDSAFYTVSTGVTGGFNGVVTLSASNPAGLSVGVSPGSITGAGSASLSVFTDSTTAAGTYQITVTGTSGSLSHSVSVTVKVTNFTDGCGTGHTVCP
ncbi:MAG: hypothetical protein LAO78_07945 [Acidobacteriia bacterium]|nr:hypothetical protein [Terriglobia bacterium]